MRLLFFLFFICSSLFADQSVTLYRYTAAGSAGTITNGAKQIIFSMANGFNGSVGNASFTISAGGAIIPISARGDGKSLSSVDWTIGPGAKTIIICEVR